MGTDNPDNRATDQLALHRNGLQRGASENNPRVDLSAAYAEANAKYPLASYAVNQLSIKTGHPTEDNLRRRAAEEFEKMLDLCTDVNDLKVIIRAILRLL